MALRKKQPAQKEQAPEKQAERRSAAKKSKPATASPARDRPMSAAEQARRAGRRRLWRLLGGIALVAVVAGLVATAYFSPLMSVRQVDVAGNGAVPRDEVLSVAEVPLGVPLLQVDPAVIAARVAAIPALETARVARSYPSTLTIDVVERTPRVLIDDGKLGVMDRLGVVYVQYDSREQMGTAAASGIVYRDLPTLDVPTPGPQDPTTHAALDAVGELPDWLRRDVTSVSASSPSDLTLHLTKDRTAIWGDSGRGAEKADALKHVLRLTGTTFNVSSPDFPAVS